MRFIEFLIESNIIKQKAKLAYHYAKDVINNRFPKGEPIIAKDPDYAYHYAKEIIKGRFPEGEPAIAKNPKYAYLYTKNIINKSSKNDWYSYQQFLQQLDL